MSKQTIQSLQINWQNRLDPLEATALVATRDAAIRLARKLLSFDDEKLNLLHGVSANDLLLIAGKAEHLPWVNGVIYLGKDSLAPSILLPTTVRPNIPIDLFEVTLLNQFPDQLPFAAIENRIVQTGQMRPITRKILQDWVEEKL